VSKLEKGSAGCLTSQASQGLTFNLEFAMPPLVHVTAKAGDLCSLVYALVMPVMITGPSRATCAKRKILSLSWRFRSWIASSCAG
jgi:hypothetical protein